MVNAVGGMQHNKLVNIKEYLEVALKSRYGLRG
jgi:hypothetical protein